MAIDWDFISELEGGQSLTGYVPDPTGSMSGVTIATGVDLGQMTAASINALRISDALKAKLVPYAGLKGREAQAYLNDHPLSITEPDADALDQVIKQPIVDQLQRKYDEAVGSGAFNGLPDQAQTVIASVAFQYGPDLSQRTPRFWGKVTAKDWAGAVYELRHFGDAYPTRRNKEADLLQEIVPPSGPQDNRDYKEARQRDRADSGS